MATTTPNYGWTVPTSTDLVKDGATAIETLGDAVDATVFANANAAIAKTIVDAKGDLIAATAADTVARLAVGANNTVLTADSTAATGIKWATVSGGGLTSIASGSLSGSSVSLTSISGSYKDLILVMNNFSMSANAVPKVGFNSLASGCAQGSNFIYFGTSPTATYDFINPFANRALDAGYSTGTMYVRFQNYTATTPKTFYAAGTGFDQSAGGLTYGWQFGFLDSISALTSIQMTTSTGTFDAGTYILYGVS